MEKKLGGGEVNFVDNSKKRVNFWIIVGSLVVIIMLFFGYVAYFYKEKTNQLEKRYQQQIQSLQRQQNQFKQQNQQDLSSNIQGNASNSQEIAEIPTIKLKKILVDWEKKTIEVKENCNGVARCFLVGKIANDDPLYKGKDFYLEVTPSMGGSEMTYFIIEKGSDGITENKLYINEGLQEAGTEATIVGIDDLPEEIPLPETSYQLKKYYSPTYLFSEVKIKNKLFTNKEIGDFYLTEGEGCIVAELPNHTAIAYNLVIPFVNNEDRVINVTFNDGKKNQDEYDYINHTCGGVCTNLLEMDPNDLKPEERLQVVGKTVNGEDILGIKDPNDQYLKDLYNNEQTLAYYGGNDNQQQGGSKYTYEEFIKSNPYLYWKNPLGKWIEFKNSKFSPAAEMCKPVIYLYPQNEINLSVKVSPNGGFTHTDPAYNNGWTVNVLPNGKIKNLEGGKEYDYLLWEGIGANYPKQDKGWVVKREDLNLFLSEKLQILGLNEKEASDFKEYWLARLNEKPFYKISFLSREQFDSLAPVEFNPIKPDVFIRVMMTAEELDDYANISEQILPAKIPRRNGFTAVEWGGTLLK
jgi:uncharacterized protein YpmB